MGNKVNLEGVRVTDANAVEADGGFKTDGLIQASQIRPGDLATNLTIRTLESLKPIVIYSTNLQQLDPRAGNYVQIKGQDGIILHNLPTSDPVNTDQIWNDAGTLKVSAG